MDRTTQRINSGNCTNVQELVLRVRAVLDDSILRLAQVRTKTGRANSTIWRDISLGIFPPPINLGPKAVGWKNSEILGWIEARSISSRSQQPIDMQKFVAMLIAPKDSGAQK